MKVVTTRTRTAGRCQRNILRALTSTVASGRLSIDHGRDEYRRC